MISTSLCGVDSWWNEVAGWRCKSSVFPEHLGQGLRSKLPNSHIRGMFPRVDRNGPHRSFSWSTHTQSGPCQCSHLHLLATKLHQGVVAFRASLHQTPTGWLARLLLPATAWIWHMIPWYSWYSHQIEHRLWLHLPKFKKRFRWPVLGSYQQENHLLRIVNQMQQQLMLG